MSETEAIECHMTVLSTMPMGAEFGVTFCGTNDSKASAEANSVIEEFTEHFSRKGDKQRRNLTDNMTEAQLRSYVQDLFKAIYKGSKRTNIPERNGG